jgi:hypothetical protein
MEVIMSTRLRLPLTLAVLLWAGLSSLGRPLVAQEPVLKSVGIIVRTHDDDKDNDTTVQAWTTVPGGRFALTAATFSCDSSECRFPDHSDRHIELKPDGAYGKSLFAQGFATHIWITTVGDDSWRFTPTTVLTFSDGSTLQRQSAATEMNEERRYHTY